MTHSDEIPCEFCMIGYHAPFERFEKIASISKGPAILMRCKLCKILWHETLRSAVRVSVSEAHILYSEVKKEVSNGIGKF